jgi:hypothetical protein
MAVHRAIGTRDPFGYPKLENDDDFLGLNTTRVSFFGFLEALEIN